MGVYFVSRIKIARVYLLVEKQNELIRLVHRYLHLRLTYIDLPEAKQTQEALIAMSQLEHEVGDFLGLNQK